MPIISLDPRLDFLYEFQLAQLELQPVAPELVMRHDIGGGVLATVPSTDGIARFIIERSAYAWTVDGVETNYATIANKNVTKSANQYLTHWFYPYKAKFHPQMVRALINAMRVQPGETVLDPFSGSGTTAIESQLLGINCIGIDISPLCMLQGNVKVTAWKHIPIIKELEPAAVEHARSDPSGRSMTDLLSFMGGKRKAYRDFLSSSRKHGQAVHDFYKLAQLIAISSTKKNKKDIASVLAEKLPLMIQSIEMQKDIMDKTGRDPAMTIRQGDARALDLPGESIDAVLTSPPYALAINYVKNDEHALRALGKDVNVIKSDFIGVGEYSDDAMAKYNDDLSRAIGEMHRVLKPGKFCTIVIGDSTWKGEPVTNVKNAIEFGKKIGLDLAHDIPKVILGGYTRLWHEHILIFKKN